MKLQEVQVGNLAVFTTATFKELGDFVVLVGANGSGKSFFLQALDRLFEEFRISGGASSWSNEAYYWHRRRTNKPITVEVLLSLSEYEVERVFAPVQEVLEEVRREAPAKLNQLKVRRDLDFGKGWRTASLACADRELVRDDEVVSSSVVVSRPKRRDKALDAWVMEGFPPAATDSWKEHPRLLVNRGNGQAFQSNAEMDDLAEAGVIPVSLDAAGKEYHEWASGEGLTLNDRPPQEPEAAELFKASKRLTQFPAHMVSAELQQLLNSSFMLVAAVREEQNAPGQRSSSLSKGTVNEVNALLADLSNVEAEENARRLRQAYSEFTGKRLRDHTQGLFVEDGQALPFGYQGGGEQAIFHEWASGEGLTLNDRPPQEPEAAELFKASKRLTQFPAHMVSAELQQLLNSSFMLVAAVREEQNAPGQRSSSLSKGTVNEVNALLADLSNVEAEENARRLRQA